MISSLPALNACLNSLSAFFLIFGFIFIKKKKISQHKFCMLAACLTSVLFLTSYLYYHYHHGATRYQGAGLSRIIYFSILISHTLLAIAIVPMILSTLRKAFKGEIEPHRRIAKITFPLWLYVSATGVLIYVMLYQL